MAHNQHRQNTIDVSGTRSATNILLIEKENNMPIKVIKSNEVMEVKNICMTIYSQPGLGKTSLAFTSINPLLIDFDHGSYRAVDRGDVVAAEKWSDVAGISQEDLEDYDTIVIDTVGKALDALSNHIIQENAKLGYGGALNQQGWGQLGIKFSAFLRRLKGFGKDIVLISHMDEKADGDSIKERLKIQGGSKDLVLTDSDVIARISISNKQRYLVFSATETSFGKDPAQMDHVLIPEGSSDKFSSFLGNIITQTKEKLNELSADQLELKGEIQWFKDRLPEIFKAEEINLLISRAKKAGRDVSKLLVDRADELGFEFDPDQKKYIELPNDEHVEDDAVQEDAA